MKSKRLIIQFIIYVTLVISGLVLMNCIVIEDKKDTLITDYKNQIKLIETSDINTDVLLSSFNIIKLVYVDGVIVDSPKDYPPLYKFDVYSYNEEKVNFDNVGAFIYRYYVSGDTTTIYIQRLNSIDFKIQNMFYLCCFLGLIVIYMAVVLSLELVKMKKKNHKDLSVTLFKEHIDQENDINNFYNEIETRTNLNHIYERFLSNGSNAIFLFNEDMNMIFHNNKANNYVVDNGRFYEVENKDLNDLLEIVKTTNYEEGKIDIEDEHYIYTTFSERIDGKKYYGLYLTNITETVKYKNNQIAFFNQASHELRTPLTSIIGFLELLVYTQFDQSLGLETLDMMYIESKKMDLLISSIIDISKRFKMDDLFAKNNLNEIVCESLKNNERFLGIEVRNMVDKNAMLMCNDVKVEVILSNLLKNSFMHNISGGYIELISESRLGFIDLRIRNTTNPIDEQLIKTVYEPFFKKKYNPEDEAIGPGFGLCIVKSICDAYNYEIDFVYHAEEEIFEIILSFYSDVIKGRL